MNQDTLTFTFPMFVLAIGSIGGGILAWAIKKWVHDTEKSRETKDSEVHESFKLLGMKLDGERDKRENLKEELSEIKIQMAGMVKHEEMAAFASDIGKRIDKISADVIAALSIRLGGQ